MPITTIELIVVGLITLISIIGIIVAGPYIKKVTNCYFFWLAIALVFLIWLIAGRFAYQVVDFVRHGNDHGLRTANALLMNMCPFCALIICIAVIADPSRRFAKIIAPFALLGGVLTIIAGVPDELVWPDQGQSVNFIVWLLWGDSYARLYFMTHYINIVMALLVLVSVPKMRLADWIYCHIFAGTYYLYVFIMMMALHVTNSVSGLAIDDWIPHRGEYGMVTELFGGNPKVAIAVSLIIAYIAISGFIFGQNRLQLIKKYRWFNIRDPKQKWYLSYYYLNPPKEMQSHESPSFLYKIVHLIKK